METLQIRIDDEITSDLRELMHLLKMSKSETARNALAEGIRRLKMDIATRKYLNGEFTLGRAAEYSRTSIQEMAEYLAEHGVAYFRYDPSELVKDAATAEKHLKKKLRPRK
jgi:predicted HTH domain antitoxin